MRSWVCDQGSGKEVDVGVVVLEPSPSAAE
jgi:hypothetical protein